MAHKMSLKASPTAFGGKAGGTTPAAQGHAIPLDPMRAERAALTKRLIEKANAAERGQSVSLAGLTDDELIAALKAC